MNEGLPWQRQIFEAVPCSIALLMLGFGKLNPPKPLEFSVIELQYRSRRIWQARTKTDRESPCVFLFVRPHIVAWRVAKPSNTRFSAVLRTCGARDRSNQCEEVWNEGRATRDVHSSHSQCPIA